MRDLLAIHGPQHLNNCDKQIREVNIIRKPKVLDLNDTMGGVDRLDQKLDDYPLIKNCVKSKYY